MWLIWRGHSDFLGKAAAGHTHLNDARTAQGGPGQGRRKRGSRGISDTEWKLRRRERALYRVLGLLLLHGGLRTRSQPTSAGTSRESADEQMENENSPGNPKYWEAGQSPTSETTAAKRRKHGDPKAPTHVSARSDQQPSHLLLPRGGVTQRAESRPQSLGGRTG